MTPTLQTPPCRGSSAETTGWRVDVLPSYLPANSDPVVRKWTFLYRITVTNGSEHPARLISRHWTIVNAHGESDDIRGEGVVGEQPLIEPGESFSYQSFCPLTTCWGTMEGDFTMRATDGERFEIRVERFFLVGPPR